MSESNFLFYLPVQQSSCMFLVRVPNKVQLQCFPDWFEKKKRYSTTLMTDNKVNATQN